MAGNDFGLFKRLIHQHSRLPCDITVAYAMETIFTDAMLFVEVHRQAVEIRLLRHRLMNGCIEYGHIRHIRQNLPANFYTQNIRRIVEGCKFGIFSNGIKNIFIDKYGMRKFFASMHNAMADTSDFFKVTDNTVLRTYKCLSDNLQEPCDGRAEVFRALLRFDRPAYE